MKIDHTVGSSGMQSDINQIFGHIYKTDTTLEKYPSLLGKSIPEKALSPSSSIFDYLYLHKSTLLGNKEFIEAPNGL